MRPLGLAALVGLVLSPGSAFAWSVHGHQTVALIAQDKLKRESPDTLAKINALLAYGLALGQAAPTMADVAPCADQVRLGFPSSCGGIRLQGDRATQPLHFVNIPVSDHNPDVERYCAGNCVTSAVQSEYATLKDPQAGPQDKQLALIYLIHFVGDMHQPLHCAYSLYNGKNDYGGNEELVTLLGTKLKLHAVWDHLIEPQDVLTPSDLATTLGSEGSGSADDVLGGKAALESFQISQGKIYDGAGNAIAPDDAYQAEMQQVVFDRLELAGVRLAAVLEQAFAGQQAPGVAKAPAAAPAAIQAGMISVP